MSDLLTAIHFAKVSHKDQKYGDKPYLYHLHKVASVANKYGGNSTDLVCAVLHDVVEDTPVTVEDLRDKFGAKVAHVVDLLTNRPSKEDTFNRIRTNPRAVFIKLCDRIANVEEGGKRNKYRNEYPLFKKILYRKGEFDSMWKHLDELLM